MGTVKGFIKKISSKSGTTKGRAWTAYSIGVDVGDGGITWYRLGFDAPTVQEGSYVTFDTVEQQPGVFKVSGDIAVSKPPAGATQKLVQQEDTKSDSIVRQNAASTAAIIIRDMIDVGALVLPKAANKKYDAYLEYHTQITNTLFVANRHAPSVQQLLDAGAVEVPAGEDEVTEDDIDEDAWPEV